MFTYAQSLSRLRGTCRIIDKSFIDPLPRLHKISHRTLSRQTDSALDMCQPRGGLQMTSFMEDILAIEDVICCIFRIWQVGNDRLLPLENASVPPRTNRCQLNSQTAAVLRHTIFVNHELTQNEHHIYLSLFAI